LANNFFAYRAFYTYRLYSENADLIKKVADSIKNKGNNDFPTEMANTIRWLRETHGAKQIVWAELLGMDRSNYSRIELGKRPLTFKQLEILAKEVEMRPEEIVVLAGILNRTGYQLGCFAITIKAWLTLLAKVGNIKFTEEEVNKIISAAEDIYLRKIIIP